jgi:hypothetical protein
MIYDHESGQGGVGPSVRLGHRIHALIFSGVDFRRSHMDLVSVLQQAALYMMHSHLVSIVTIAIMEDTKSDSHMSISPHLYPYHLYPSSR